MMHHVAKQAIWEPLENLGSCIPKGDYQPTLTNLNILTYITYYFHTEMHSSTTNLLDVLIVRCYKNMRLYFSIFSIDK